ncbi:MAG: rhodanese-like domain-containing protein [Caldilineaceae bacterium]|nr:rhodanese-like domain-containing protein [Caldilineaceae bacterium]
MGLFKSIKKFFGGDRTPAPSLPPARPPYEPEPEPDVAEVSATDLLAELAAGADWLLLDCREIFEHQMAHIPDDLHIPMDEIPGRLAELESATQDKSRPVVVYCASGMRSFGVASFLQEQGYSVRNLSGGITRWQMAKGPVQR